MMPDQIIIPLWGLLRVRISESTRRLWRKLSWSEVQEAWAKWQK